MKYSDVIVPAWDVNPAAGEMPKLAMLQNLPNRQLRMNLRNAWMAESARDIRLEAVNRAAQGKWFEAAVLFELACDVYAEG